MTWFQIGVLALLASCGKGSGGDSAPTAQLDDIPAQLDENKEESEESPVFEEGQEELDLESGRKLRRIEIFQQKKGTRAELDPSALSFDNDPYKPLKINPIKEEKDSKPISSIWDFNIFGPSFKFPLSNKEAKTDTTAKSAKKYFTHQTLWSSALKEKILKLSQKEFSLQNSPSTAEILAFRPQPSYELKVKVPKSKEKNIFAEQVTQFVEKKAKYPTLDTYLEALDSPENCSLEKTKQHTPTYDDQVSSPWCYAFSAARGLNPLLGENKVSYYFLSALNNLGLKPAQELNFNLLSGGNDFRALLEMQRLGYYYTEENLPFDGELHRAFYRVLDLIWKQTESLPSVISVKGARYSFDLKKSILLDLKSKSADRIEFYNKAREEIFVKLSSLVDVGNLKKVKIPDFSLKFWTLEKNRKDNPHEEVLVKYFEELRGILARGERVLISECANNIYKFDKDAKDTPLSDTCEDHAMSLVGLYWDKTQQKCMTSLENSWGKSFGDNGIQNISLEDFLRTWRKPKELIDAVERTTYRFSTVVASSAANEYISIDKDGEVYANSFKRNFARGMMFLGHGQGQELFFNNNSLRIKKGNFIAGEMNEGDLLSYNSLADFKLNSARSVISQSAEPGIETVLNELSKVTHHGLFKGNVLLDGLSVTYYPSGAIDNLFSGTRDELGNPSNGVSLKFDEKGKLSAYQEGTFEQLGMMEGVSLSYEHGVLKHFRIFVLDEENRKVQLLVSLNSDGTFKNDSLLTYVDKNPDSGYKRSSVDGKMTSFRTYAKGVEVKHTVEVMAPPSLSPQKPLKDEASELWNSFLDIWTTKPRAKNSTSN